MIQGRNDGASRSADCANTGSTDHRIVAELYERKKGMKHSLVCRLTGILTVVLAVVCATGSAIAAENTGQAAALEPTENDSKVTIEIGLLSTDAKQGSTQWFLTEIASFSKAHPDIQVETVSLGGPDRFERAEKGLDGLPSLPRNIIGLCSWFGSEIPYLATTGDIVPMDDFLPDPELDLDVFYENLFEPVRFDGKIWGVPWATEPVVLACNWPLFEAAGIPEPPRTWDELVDYAQRLTMDTDGAGVIDQRGLRFRSPDTIGLLFLSLVFQQGGHIMTSEGFDVATDVAVSAVEFIHELLGAEYSKPSERCAMEFTHASWLTMHTQDRKNSRLAFLPTFGPDDPRTQANIETFYLGIRRDTPEREAASWEFVKWMSRRDVSLPSTVNAFPCRRDFIEREDFKARAAGSYMDLDVLYRSNEHLHDVGPTNLMWRGRALGVLENYLGQAIMGVMPAREALTLGTEKANEVVIVIKTPNATSYKAFR